ncbi:Gas vesicle synthesis protein GvpL/GvpF [Synechococcus sp. PCC 7502]|uniref:GvpL/GvpF family gas vesicle protein n=1 Tax=Synechococcus sp. PCC 7502 TaxID=1173263 RepID=UPI00029FB610|nr:GvpL/GvpF family gas vesicle protein [Synechococcus sp. PCC 7502]AFY73702.1 Gas vesicle synthesis protein GvpL/GvpF [Synechococcus sp. PCC 7502]
MSLYLYAIANGQDLEKLKNSLKIEGMNQQPVQFQEIDPFTLVYSEALQERYLASRANLLTHERVIEAVMKVDVYNVPLPLQFGLVVDDWAEVKQKLIEGHQSDLKDLLNKLQGKREVGIKLFWDQIAELNLILGENTELNQKRESLMGKTLSMDAAIAIGKELESALNQKREEIVGTFLEVLQPLSYEYVVGDLLTENMLYNAAFLIAWDRESEFAIAIENLDAKYDHRLRIRYNNFTAPFNFVNLGQP